jgi:cell division protein FtsX
LRPHCEKFIDINSREDELSLKNDFIVKINNYPAPKDLQMLLSVKYYDGTADLDNHIETVDTLLSFLSAHGLMNCKIFVLILKDGALAWFKSLKPLSINA